MHISISYVDTLINYWLCKALCIMAPKPQILSKSQLCLHAVLQFERTHYTHRHLLTEPFVSVLKSKK